MTLKCVERNYIPLLPTNLRQTLGSLRRSAADPTLRMGTYGIWRATRTPDGPAVQHLEHRGTGIHMRAWGPGADWLADRLPTMLGANDDDANFEYPGIIGEIQRKHPGLRIPRTEAVWEALFPAILEQKVTGAEAWDSFRRLHRLLGDPAPTPPDGPRLMLPLDPVRVAGTPGHTFMRCNVERKRSDTIRQCAEYAHRIEETVHMSITDARARLGALPGVGAWTVAEVGIRALGDSDAVSVGDYHIKNLVAWNLAGKPRGTDEEMLELLEPYRPHRGRVVLLLQHGGSDQPRYGPRLTIQKRW
jgi:3-methyladenine DNA glycosylase/8-oxoguanine DNA glycosylase